MATANAERGERALTLAGVTYPLRPSYAAIVAIEAKGESLVELVNKGRAGTLGLAQLGAIAAELIRAGADDELTRNVGAPRISELIYEEGLPYVIAALTTCLTEAVLGGRTVTGEAKPATTDTTSPAAGAA